MMIEQEMVILKAEDLESYKEKHCAKEELPTVKFFSAHVPENDFYLGKIKALELENMTLRQKNKHLERCMKLAEVKVRDQNEKISKLEKAYIAAAIR